MDTLKVIFLGGVGEIGKNITAFEYRNDIIVVDCGSAFPSIDMPGVDLVVPDVSYLIDNIHKIRGFFLTHGHEDHIGGLPYLLKQFGIHAPIYASNLTLALLEHKFKEHKIENVNVNIAQKNTVIKAGAFSVEFIKVSHSISGSFALYIQCPVAKVFHTGDFKIDYNPIDGEMIDLRRIAELSKKGITLLLSESTNIERPGYSMSESTVGKSLYNFFVQNTKRRLIVATFASNIHRIQQIIDLAQKFERKVAFSGHSMHNVLEAASKIGEIKYDKNQIVDLEKTKKIDDDKLVIITTGSQGEPMSALTRMASGEFNKVKITDNDTVIISASPIPGNEKLVYNVINNLYQKGAKVIYEALADVHVSGHAFREELKLIYLLVKPKFFIPVHGEIRHLKQHMEMIADLGHNPKHMLMPQVGNKIEVCSKFMKRSDNVTAGNVLVDGAGIGDVGAEVLRDRRRLSEDGMLLVIMGIEQGGTVSSVDVITRGFIYARESVDLIEEIKRVSINSVNGIDLKVQVDREILKNNIRKNLRNFLNKKIKRSPMILPIIIEN
ncbi:MAG TPA: ribonuclease J [Clostridiales bacterium]|nr:ribonuclease J [Clostridiales bacterium]